VKRVPGSSGRVHKNTEGEWVWSDDEMKDDANEAAAEPVSATLSHSGDCCRWCLTGQTQTVTIVSK